MTVTAQNTRNAAYHTRNEAYLIIEEEARMIRSAHRPINTTIRWLKEAINLLENAKERQPKTQEETDIEAACEIIEAMKKASFPEMCALLGYTGRETARILTDARSRELIKLVDGFYYITSR